MNRTALSALVLAASFAGSAFAESPTVLKDDFVSARTRAEVSTELAAYRQSGVNPWSIQYNPLRHFTSTTSRDAVVAEYLAARDEVKAFGGEDSGSTYLAQGHTPSGGISTIAGLPRNPQ